MKHSGWMLSIRDTRNGYRYNYGKRLSAEDAKTLARFINSFLVYEHAEAIPYDPLFQDATDVSVLLDAADTNSSVRAADFIEATLSGETVGPKL